MNWRTLSSKKIYEDKWQEVVVNSFQTPRGSIGEWLVVNKKNDAAAILAQNDKGEIALESIYRYAVDDQIWQIPLEAIEEIEDEMSAAQRGAKEELGLWAETIEKLGEFYIDAGTMKQSAKVFLLTGLETMQNQLEKMEEEMITEVVWFSVDAIDEMVRTRKICDAWTLGALHLLKLKSEEK